MIVKPTDTDGVEHVYRAEGEPPIAQLTAPRLMPHKRQWGVRYRNGKQTGKPFGGCFNVTKRNKEHALRDVQDCIHVCNDYQLGLVDKP